MYKTRITYAEAYVGLPILTDVTANLGCCEEMLGRLREVFFHALNNHSKVLLTHLTFTFPVELDISSDNHLFKTFISYYIKSLKREDLDPLYFWAREQSMTNSHQHYHCLLFLNGQKIQNIYRIHNRACDQWGKALNIPSGAGYVHYSETQPCMMIRRDSPDYNVMIEKAFRWGSYCCKVNTKGLAPDYTREYSSSLIPHD